MENNQAADFSKMENNQTANASVHDPFSAGPGSDIFNRINTVILIIDPATAAILDANRAACQFYGYPHDAFVRLSIHDLALLSSGEIQDNFRKFANQEIASLYVQHRLANGEIRDVEVFSGLAELDHRKVLIASIHDVTIRKQLENSLAEHDRHLRKILDTIPDLIWSARPDGTADFLNQSWLQYTGLAEDQALGNGWFMAMHPDELPGIMQKWQDAIRNGVELSTEHRFRRFDGEYRWFKIHALPELAASGEIVKWYGKNEDITERRYSEERYRAQFRNLPFPSYTWQRQDNDFVLLDYNDAAFAVSGGSIARFIGSSARRMYQQEPDVLNDFERCYSERRLIRRDLQTRMRSTGQIRDFDTSFVYLVPDLVVVNTIDITERKQSERALREDKELFQVTITSALEGIIVTDQAGCIILINPAAELMSGWTRDEAIGKKLHDIFQPLPGPGNTQLLSGLMAGNPPRLTEKVLTTGQRINMTQPFGLLGKHDKDIYIMGSFAPILAPDQTVTGMVITFKDISRQVMLEGEIDGFLNVNLDMLAVCDPDGNFIKVNRKFTEVLGYTAAEIEGQNLLFFTHPDDIQSTTDLLASLGKGNPVAGFINRCRCQDSTYRFLEWNSLPGTGRFIYTSARDVTSQLMLENQLRQAAIKDDLTGLYNRRFFETIIYEQMERSDRYDEPLSLAVLDLDHFKQVNDRWGHPSGDELLQITAQTIGKTIRSSDILVRFGGEEFVILLPQTALNLAGAAAERIRAAVEAVVHPVYGRQTVSIGVCERMKSESFNHWYRRADAALYDAKHEGRNRVVATDLHKELPVDSLLVNMKEEWQSGNRDIDGQHQALTTVANELTQQIARKAPSSVILQQLDVLMRHVASHFAWEEKFLAEIGYPDQSLHKILHSSVIDKLRHCLEWYKNGQVEPSALVSYIVDDVIVYHLESADSRYFDVVRNSLAAASDQHKG